MRQLMKHCRFSKQTSIQAIWELVEQKKGKFFTILKLLLASKTSTDFSMCRFSVFGMMNKVVKATLFSVLMYLFAYWTNLFVFCSVCDTNGQTSFEVIKVAKFCDYSASSISCNLILINCFHIPETGSWGLYWILKIWTVVSMLYP